MPIGDQHNGPAPRTATLAVSSTKLPRRKQKRKDSDTKPPSQRTTRPLKQRRTTHRRPPSPGHDLCALFLSYLENHTDPTFNELTALENLSTELTLLSEHAPAQPSAQDYKLVNAFATVSFPAWLEYRTEIVTAKRKLAEMQTSAKTTQQRQLAVQERSRLASQLRQAREKFMGAGYSGLRTEQIIVRAVEALMGGTGVAQMQGDLRKALLGMDEELMELGDALMKVGGAKWVMGDFQPVSILDGLRADE